MVKGGVCATADLPTFKKIDVGDRGRGKGMFSWVYTQIVCDLRCVLDRDQGTLAKLLFHSHHKILQSEDSSY